MPMEPLRSALFLDFDNFFSGLLQLDREAAYVLADEPKRWLDALAGWKLPAGGERRRLLVRRAYLNPAGWVNDREFGNERGRLYFSIFRPSLIRAGFEVVDCPVLAARQKNAADIRIVIDTLQALDANTRYDEFILASSDADYAPLLRLLRANDRRTVIIATGQTSPAYHNIADLLIYAEDLVGLLTPERAAAVDPDAGTGSGDAAAAAAAAGEVISGGAAEPGYREQVERLIYDYVDRQEGPSLLSSLGIMLRSGSLGEAIDRSGWFGAGTLGALIRSLEGASELRVKGHYVWNAARHAEPEEEEADTLAGMPAFIAHCCRITDLPRLNRQSWKATFAALARYAAAYDFNLTHCTAWTRDQLKGEGVHVGRQAIGFVVRGVLFGGVRLAAKPAPNADQIRDALLGNTLDRAQAQGAEVTERDRAELREWLGADGGTAEPAAQPGDQPDDETGAPE